MVIVGSLTTAVYSLSSLTKVVYHYHKSAAIYKALQTSFDGKKNITKKEELAHFNKDYVGWIKIADTNVDYPVVKGKGNDFYLTHNFYRKEDFVGSIFMDYRNSVDKLDKHVILYGHNMKDKSMFGSLKKYLNRQFFNEHKKFSFNFQGNAYEWEIFSVYTTENTDWMTTQFGNDKDFNRFLNETRILSIYHTQTKVGPSDHILTLSSCTTRHSNWRIVIHAKLLKREENKINEL